MLSSPLLTHDRRNEAWTIVSRLHSADPDQEKQMFARDGFYRWSSKSKSMLQHGLREGIASCSASYHTASACGWVLDSICCADDWCAGHLQHVSGRAALSLMHYLTLRSVCHHVVPESRSYWWHSFDPRSSLRDCCYTVQFHRSCVS